MDDLDKEMKISFIDEARQLLEAAEQCFLDLESTRGNGDVLENIFRLAHNMKGTSRAVGFGEVAEFTHNLENLLLRLKEGKLSVDDETVNLLLECNDHLKMMVDTLSIDMDAKFDSRELSGKIMTKLEGGSIGTGSMTKASHHFELDSGVEITEQTPVVEYSEPIPEPSNNEAQVPPAGDSGGKKPPPGGQSQVEESIRVSVNRLEKLSDFIGELVILQTVLNQHRAEIASPLLQKTVQQLSKISKEIQDISMSLRMIPLKQTFAKLQRIVRDTSKALDKEVELHLEGEGTEVDKTVLEQVSDPLVHIIRNAIDHGIESTAERLQVGKSKEGHVLIRAFHQGNNLVIEVTDDGRGLNPRKIMKKAVQKGIVSEGTQLSDYDAIQLIFEPGFSTKDQVSEISGRGVGLDVVKTNVERLGGQVQLDSEAGHGSCFRILLPLTLAIIDGMVVRSGDERYVVPIANVQETVQPKREDVNVVSGRGEVLNIRDTTIPLVRLSTILRSSNSQGNREAWQCIAIIANSRRQPFAILVDDILRQQQIVIKKLGAEIRIQKGLAGSAILGDGKPALILDLNELMESYVNGLKEASSPRAMAV
jgi:two-component system chemotaxis sensor kinase CheA